MINYYQSLTNKEVTSTRRIYGDWSEEYINISTTVIPSKLTQYYEHFAQQWYLWTRDRRQTIKLMSARLVASTFKEVSSKYFPCVLPRITVPDQFLKVVESSLFWKLYSTVKMRKSKQSIITLQMKLANYDYDLVVSIGLNWHLGHLKPLKDVQQPF